MIRRIWRLLFGERPNYPRIESLERELGFIPAAEPTLLGMEYQALMTGELPPMSKVQYQMLKDQISPELAEDQRAMDAIVRTFRLPGPRVGYTHQAISNLSI